MYEVTVEDTFAAGHYLRNYKGKCENPHGHNYKVRVTLAGKELDKAGLLLDFKDLREVMKHVIDRLDHQMINDVGAVYRAESVGRKPREIFLRRDQWPAEERDQRPSVRKGCHDFRDRHDHGEVLGVGGRRQLVGLLGF